MTFKNFHQAESFIYQQIPRKKKEKFPKDFGLRRTKFFLKLIGNPQEKIKIIHIAGTSGKGSTAYLTSLLLRQLGFKVGLMISPHLIDLRERIQINNRLLSQQKFVCYLNQLLLYFEKVQGTRFGALTYYETLTSLAFFVFCKEKVDYAVIETGMGGLYDATNTVSAPNKVAVLTKIGLDHTQILGRTIRQIAFQKAKIIHPKNMVFSLWQIPSAHKVIEEITKQENGKIFFLKKNIHFKKVKAYQEQTTFDFNFLGSTTKNIQLGLLGQYQAENCSLALAAVLYLSQRDGFEINWKRMNKVLTKAHFAGRFEIFKRDELPRLKPWYPQATPAASSKSFDSSLPRRQAGTGKPVGFSNDYKNTIIVDGAHNPQKMASLAKNLKLLFPSQKFNFLLAFKKGKDYLSMLRYLVPLAKKIILTRFFVTNQDFIHLSEEPEKIGKRLRKLNFRRFEIIEDPKEALLVGMSYRNHSLVITGSLYLIGEIYRSLCLLAH